MGNGVNFLELNNAAGTNAQTLGISRRVSTIAGAQYTLSFDYAGRPGFTTDYTKIGVYIDGVKLGTAANTSPSNSLNWQTLTYTFVGTGSPQTVRFVSEATLFNAGGRGAMLDNIALTQSRMYNSTAVGGIAALQVIAASLKDTDGSETLSIELRGLIAGSVLSDGTRTFTATAAATTATITNWSLDRLTLTPPSTYLGTMALWS